MRESTTTSHKAPRPAFGRNQRERTTKDTNHTKEKTTKKSSRREECLSRIWYFVLVAANGRAVFISVLFVRPFSCVSCLSWLKRFLFCSSFALSPKSSVNSSFKIFAMRKETGRLQYLSRFGYLQDLEKDLWKNQCADCKILDKSIDESHTGPGRW